MNGGAGQHLGDPSYTCLGYDVGMASHPQMMHYVSREGKHLSHHPSSYPVWMETASERLRLARQRAGFSSAVDAARALGIPHATYISHENGHRGFPAKRAPVYARRFKVSEEWLLYGKGDAGDPLVSEAELTEMLAEAQSQIPASLPYGEWPRAVAEAMKLRLDTLLRDRSKAGSAGRQA